MTATQLRAAWNDRVADPVGCPPSAMTGAGMYIHVWGSAKAAYEWWAGLKTTDAHLLSIGRYLLEAAKGEVK